MSLKDEIRTRPRLWVPAGLVTAGLIGGAILGSTLSASASTSTTTQTPSSSSGSSSSSTATPSMPSMPAHGSAAHEDAETPVTGSAASQAQAAAVKYVGSGTAGAVTTDFTKTGYEVTVTKSDGSQVEVHLNSSFNVMQGGPGHFGGDGDHDGPGPSSSSSSSGPTA